MPKKHAIIKFESALAMGASLLTPRFGRTACLSLLLPLWLATVGCATRPEEMVPHDLSVGRHHPCSVTVATPVQGGMPIDPALFSAGAFRTALESALTQSSLFNAVVPEGGTTSGAYTLTVTFLRLDQPALGLDMSVTLMTTWSLVRVADGKEVWTGDINGTYVAKISDELVGGARLRVATEGATREVIRTGMTEIAKLDLSTHATEKTKG